MAGDFWQKYLVKNAYQNQDFKKAAKIQEELLVKDAINIEHLVNMGKIFYQQSDYPNAANYFKKAIALELDFSNLGVAQKADLWLNLANSYAQQEQWELSLEAYEQVLNFDRNHIQAQKNIEIIKKIIEQQKQQESQDSKKQDQNQEQEQKQDSKNQEQEKEQNSGGQDSQDANQAPKSGSQDAEKQKQNQEQSQEEKAQNSPKSSQSQASQEPQESLGQPNNLENLSNQEQKYLELVEKNDQQAHNYLAKKRASLLKGQGPDNEHNW